MFKRVLKQIREGFGRPGYMVFIDTLSFIVGFEGVFFFGGGVEKIMTGYGHQLGV